jgi:DNA-binding MarR family transcriptional regulator
MNRAQAKVRSEEGGRLNLGRMGEFVGFRLRRVQNQLSRDFAEATSQYNLRSGVFSSLALIAANPGISQNELSREVALDKSVTVTIVDELERRGFATRERSTSDRRRHALFVTDAGTAFLDTLFEILTKTEDAVLHQLTPGELHLLNELLDRMYAVCVRED